MENLGGEKEKIEISKDGNPPADEAGIEEKNGERDHSQKQEEAQKRVVYMFKPDGMFGAGEMEVGGKIKEVIDHGVENTSGRF